MNPPLEYLSGLTPNDLLRVSYFESRIRLNKFSKFNQSNQLANELLRVLFGVLRLPGVCMNKINKNLFFGCHKESPIKFNLIATLEGKQHLLNTLLL